MKKKSMHFLLFFLFSFTLGAQCLAEDVGITMSTSLSSSYNSTVSLKPEITKRLDFSVKSDKKAEIGDALKKLKDGDILVMSVHSNPSVFALGEEGCHWGLFWDHFGIKNPPRLAAVIIGGCMARSYKHEGKTYYVHITDPEVNFILRNFGAKSMFLPSATINPMVAINDMTGILKQMMDEDKRLAKCSPGKRWRYVTAPGVDRIAVTLKDLRTQARGEISRGNLSGPARKSAAPKNPNPPSPGDTKQEWSLED